MEIKRIVVWWCAATVLLMLLSHFTAGYFSTCGDAENEFAHSLAGEMLAVLEQIDLEDNDLVLKGQLAEGETQFSQWKYAATHFRGRLAEDFVFAFALAGEGCRRSLQRDEGQQQQARRLLHRARDEFRLIAGRDYR